MQTPKTVEELEQRLKGDYALASTHGHDGAMFMYNAALVRLREAVALGRTLGLQEALGAGPEKAELCRCNCEENKKTNWWNAGVDAKNSAISTLIDKGEQGTL